MANADLFDKIIALLDVTSSHKQREDATKFLAWIFRTLDCDALKIFSEACKRLGNLKNKSMFVDLVVNLSSDCPITLRTQTVQFINVILSKSHSDADKQRFMASMENIGLYDTLRRATRDAQSQNNAPLLTELKQLQQLAKQVIHGSGFELEIHKDRVKVLEKQLQEVQKRNAHYIEQQAIFDLIRGDLDKYKTVFNMSRDFETMYSPFTPIHMFDQSDLKKLRTQHNIIDLKQVLQ